MDDDLDPKEDDLKEADGDFDDFDDDLVLGDKKPKRHHDDDHIESLDALADDEDSVEDSYDDDDGLW